LLVERIELLPPIKGRLKQYLSRGNIHRPFKKPFLTAFRLGLQPEEFATT
jgi:hypothetical protein